MIRSMTGYGSASLEMGPLRATVTVRSVNHRFLDLTLHLPRRLQPLEAEAKERVAAAVARGRVELSMQASLAEAATRGGRGLAPPGGLAGAHAAGHAERVRPRGRRVRGRPRALPRRARARRGARGDPGGGSRRARGAARPRPRRRSTRCGGRRASGCAASSSASLDAIEGAATRIEARSAESRELRQAALLERVRALAGELGLEDGRLYQEVVRAVERHDVAEEVQRLRSHAASARELVAAEGAPAGKRLDFLAQELMREANTVGSKIAGRVRHPRGGGAQGGDRAAPRAGAER